MDISSDVRRGVDTPADLDAAYALLADVPRSIAHFPDVESVVPHGETWVWRLRRLGAGPIQFQVHYASRYHVDPAARTVAWDAVPDVGNTRVSGRWVLTPGAHGVRIAMEARFVVDAPFPRLLRPAVEAIVAREIDRLVGAYLQNLTTTLAGGDGRPRR
ncbi:MAG: SRPBCC family protein [Pseudomonadota bacterium]|nr:SRPBCC family protein [Pseudomonadota bacterium]